LSWLSEQAERRPKARAVRCGEVALTYAELAVRAGRAAAALRAAGVGPGDRVAVKLPDGLPFVVAIHAVAWLGAVLVPTHYRWGDDETATALETVPLRGRARSHRAAPRIALLVDDPATLLSAQDIEIPEPSPQEDDALATVLYTSGTTGTPRPVPLTHGNHRASAEASGQHLNLGRGAEPDDDWLCPLPLTHVGGLAIVLRSVLHGTAFTLVPASDGFDPEAVGRWLAGGEVTLAEPTSWARFPSAPSASRSAPRAESTAMLRGGCEEARSRSMVRRVPRAGRRSANVGGMSSKLIRDAY
jgi:O-succinylbenzoic acid--CoA ligase